MASSSPQSKYCSFSALANESDVEQFLVLPLLEDLGYGSDHLRTKSTIATQVIGKGAGKKYYRPDYLGYLTERRDKPVLLVDVKHPDQAAELGLQDAQMYASIIRRAMCPPKLEQYCVGANGHRLVVKHYDSDLPLHVLAFADLVDGNPRFEALKADLARRRLLQAAQAPVPGETFALRSVDPAELPGIFEACHRSIWKAEKRGPASAFHEFAKVMFVKIDEDRRIRDEMAARGGVGISEGQVPSDVVMFSVQWINRMSLTVDNPVDTMLFRALSGRIEEQIARGEKKRIFDQDERIDLAPSTIAHAVGLLEHLDLYSVDEDLNGRLFETFLTSTMRGEALGQFFTPRAVAKFMVKMARLKATSLEMDRVLDGCCGTGGFLIEAMAEMGSAIERNAGLTPGERDRLMRRLRTEQLWGIDAGKDPPIARVARLNMHLHKDGGSRIYNADSLDKEVRVEPGLPLQTRLELEELRSALVDERIRFSVVLTNPPFAMNYERKKPGEAQVLADYTLSVSEDGKPRASLRSSVMFLERYWDLLEDGGRLLTVMDESILNTLTAEPFRKYILSHFYIRAVVALPKNTFVKAEGAVKTSVLFLQKKLTGDDEQPGIFMAICGNVGHSDTGKERPTWNRLPCILQTFQAFERSGELPAQPSSEGFLVLDLHTGNPTTRLDAHYFDPQYFSTMDRLQQIAHDRSWDVVPLKDLLRPGRQSLTGGATPLGAVYPDEGPKFIRVQNVRPNQLIWDGEIDPCIERRTHEGDLKRSQLHEGDLVLTITGTYGNAAVVPPGFGDANINQHCVRMALRAGVLPEYVAAFLNLGLCRPQLDRAVTGSSRLALDYEAIKKLQVLLPPDVAEQSEIADAVRRKLDEATSLRGKAQQLEAATTAILPPERISG